MTDKKTEALKLALDALEPRPGMPNPEYESLTQCAITAIREALAEQPANQLDDINVVDIPKIGCVNHDCDKCKAQRQARSADTWVGLTDEEIQTIWRNSEHMTVNQVCRAIEAKLKAKFNEHSEALDEDQAHYKKVIDDVQALFEAKREEAAIWQAAYETEKGFREQEQPAQQDIEELTAQRDKLADILTRTANALKGEPAELSLHSWHDLPEVAQQLKPAQQEPVAWVKSNGELVVRTDYGGRLYYSEQNLYTHPPAQQKPFGYLKLSTAKFVYEVEGTNPMSDKSYLPLYTSPPASKPWVGLTEQERNDLEDYCEMIIGKAAFEAIEAKLREKNA
jgi:uncharacterized protein YuzB (UPF0349 family)